MAQNEQQNKKRSHKGKGDNPKKPGLPRMNNTFKTLAFWVILFFLSVSAYNIFSNKVGQESSLDYSRFLSEVEAGNVVKVDIEDFTDVRGELKSGLKFKTTLPQSDNSKIIDKLYEKNVAIKAKTASSKWISILINWLPIILIIGFWLLLMRQMQAGGNKAFSFGKSKAKLLTENKPPVTFKDVAGVEEAKEELQEIIDFLKEPSRFLKLGGKIPKGALLLGPPGTGKTLLARAIAGEAGVPFFSMSGSDFVEMFVGVGASRVRDLFEQGKKHAPCIIFIDEIDAVGRHRGAGLGGGHDEREQTLNQLLVEMDGFESNEGVILVAATNRPDVLDPALLRPGRFDRRIVVDRPDVKGREGILKVHTRKIPLDEDVNLEILARGTPGFSGADLANMVNEAALLAARLDKKKVFMEDFENARDKVLMGPERKSLLINEREKKVIACHESGHALVGCMIPNTDPVHKVTIIPRGHALGITQRLPTDDKFLHSRQYCLDQMAILLGGRVAEELAFQEITTGAADDIERATELARKMVCEWGMSKLGAITFVKKEEEIFLGREIAKHRDYSERTAEAIDEEVGNLVSSAMERARTIITESKEKLDILANTLLEREVLDAEEIIKVIKGEPLEPFAPKKKPEKRVRDAKIEDSESVSGNGGKQAAALTVDKKTGAATETTTKASIRKRVKEKQQLTIQVVEEEEEEEEARDEGDAEGQKHEDDEKILSK